MIHFRILALIPLSFFASFAVCAPTEKCPNYKILASASDNKKFEALLKNSWDDMLKDSPEFGYDLGRKELGGLWTDDSLQAIQIRLNKVDCLKNALALINSAQLSKEHRVSFDIFNTNLQMSLLGRKFPSHLLSLNQLSGVHTDVVDTLLYMSQKNEVEVLNILKRLETIPQVVSQHKILLQEGLKLGVTAPQIVLSKVPAQFDDLLKKDVKDSAFFKPFKELAALDEKTRKNVQEKALLIIEQKVYPVIEDFKSFLVTTYIPQARKTTSIQDLPQGAEWYEWRIKRQTTTDMTADQVHQLGLTEVARILKGMEEVKKNVGFKRDLKAFNQFLLTDSQFYFKKPEDLIRGYRDIAKQADAMIPQFFKTMPRLTYGVRAIPDFKAPASPTAYYMGGSLSSGRAGYFEANTHDLKARPTWGMEALTLHEAVPGHHLQIALAQELGDMPEFRKYGGFTAFSEGWGLYAESLGYEMGFYKDPYSQYGQLTYEMWRAVRLVVDTGLHSKGWSRDQAIQYFMDHMAKAKSEAEVEVDRYIVWPGQALAYKVGQLKFLEIRKKAEAELKEKFDIREFHDALLSGGSLPLTLLEAKMKEWIKKEKNKKPSSRD